jgi:cobaltochelatase CobN
MKKYTNGKTTTKKVKLAYLSVGGSDLCTVFGQICESLQYPEVHIELDTFESDNTICDPAEYRQLLKSARASDLLLINMHGDVSGYKKYDQLKKILDEENINTFLICNIEESMISAASLFKMSKETYLRIKTYIQLGGPKNRELLILYLCKVLCDLDIFVPDPVKNRAQGIYHPDHPRDVSLDDYLKTLDPSKPTVGVLINQPSWVNNHLEPHDILIRSIEKMGANTIPVFFLPTPSEITGSIGGIKVAAEYFKENGLARIGSLVIAISIFSQLSLADPTDGTRRTFNYFQDLNVPVLAAIHMFRSKKAWEEDEIGMEGGELAASVAMPECDGQLTTVPFGFTEKNADGSEHSSYMEERIERIAGMAVYWARVGHVPVKNRKVSILFNGSSLSNSGLGSAGGLDSFASVCNLLQRMENEGYSIDRVPETGQEIIDEILGALTNCLEWNSDDEIPRKAIELLDTDKYKKWTENVPEKSKEWMCRNWGDPPGDIMSYDGKFIIPGVMNGNIYLGMEPNRGKHDKAEELVHDPLLTPPHFYLAYYRWIARALRSDIHIHIGTHGSLEWLPGKGNALSEECFPDIVMDNIPNLYAYVIDDPSEGIVAKRRKKSVLVDHLMPSLTRADTYDELLDLEGHIQNYLFVKETMQNSKTDTVGDEIYALITKLCMWKELGLEPNAPIEDVLPKCEVIFDYILNLKDGLITDGLHIMGHIPTGRHLEEMVYCLTRLKNGRIPSLRMSIAENMGFDLNDLLDNASCKNNLTGEINGIIIDRIDRKTQELIYRLQETGYDKARCLDVVFSDHDNNENIRLVVEFICDAVYPGIVGISDEINNMIVGLEGGYVPPGPSGSPTRGNAHLLPTGKNFYSLDPEAVPSQVSWKVGSKMADDMIKSHIEKEGAYPESVGIVIWSIDTMKTGGDDVAYILYLMGVRPTWGSVGGKINGLEIMSQEELGRPRIDVTVRISSLFRDTFPNLFQLIDEAVEMVANLDESEEKNFIKKHLQKDIAEMIKSGMTSVEAKELSLIRVFGEPPGTHGAGVDVLIESSKWTSVDDLANMYVTCGCSAYGRKFRGEKKPELFRHRLNQLEAVVKNQVDREFDLIDVDDGYGYVGGINAVIRSSGNKKPVNYIGDSSDPDRIKTRNLEGEMAYIMRTRFLNPKWIDGLKDHGFVGANLIADNLNHTLGWDATSDVIEDWMYESIANHFLMDEDNRKWIEESNPYALRDILSDLLEAIDRGLWESDEDMKKALQELYMDAEGVLEEVTSKK